MSRLQAVWAGLTPSANNLEHATHACLTLWLLQFADLDVRAVNDWSFPGRLEAVKVSTDALARAIDDEVTWRLGNRPERVTLIADDSDTSTVGDLVVGIAMFTILHEKLVEVVGRVDNNPLATRLLTLGRQYDATINDLINGKSRQPRRRSHGAPPIQAPGRIDLVRDPTPGQP
ncbi:hypothetical protein [Nocardia takedensis]|uniref:hypothetical protein n=1 Tax=Nocardia takedensis TaxID=259390 RepID=UPI0002D55930|nr:hypothetical protein [Nocardia takedensis]